MWIFSEDFEGCRSVTDAVNLTRISNILANGSTYLHFDETNWNFTTPEQAQAAYQKIKGMLQGKDNTPQIPIMGLSVGFE